MPLGSALTSVIDIDFTRAQGENSSGRIFFKSKQMKIGTTLLSSVPVEAVVKEGVAQITLVRLPMGTYHVHQFIDGRPPIDFDFALPLSSPDEIQYENIAPVSPVPATYTVVRTVNGTPPDPTTGNLNIAVGGAANLNDLSDVTLASLINNQALLYHLATNQWRNTALAAIALTGAYADLSGKPTIPSSPGDVGAAPASHNHVVANITDFATEVDSRIQAIVDSAPFALDTLRELADALGNDPDFAATMISALAGKAALVHGHVVSDVTGLQDLLDVKAPLLHSHTLANITGLQAALDAKQRAIRTTSQYFTSVSGINPLPSTSGAWVALAMESSVPAVVGDRIRVGGHGMRSVATGVHLDLGVVTGSGPTLIRRYLATGTSTPAFEGDPGWYFSNSYVNQSAPRQFTVGSNDLDGSNVRVAAVCRGNGTGTLFADASYPAYMLLENIGPEPS